MGRISEHDRRMRRRLARIVPLAILAHFLALVTFERVAPLRELISLGYKGPTAFEPKISIIDSRDAPAKVTSRERRVMVVQDVVIVEEDKPKSPRGKEPAPKPAERKRERKVSIPIAGDYAYRSYASRAPVPYREDYVIIRMIEPEYPADALADREEGHVLIEAYIASDGTVDEAYVRSSYGPVSFEVSSLAAVRQFLFQPVRANGAPVSFWVSFLVKFNLRG